MLKASVLMTRPLTQSAQIRWVRTTLTFIVDCYFNLPNWQEWMKLENWLELKSYTNDFFNEFAKHV